MRVATRTEGGVGEFSRAQTVNYRLPDNLLDSAENNDRPQPDVSHESRENSSSFLEYSDEENIGQRLSNNTENAEIS
jgi:hypothetical protein